MPAIADGISIHVPREGDDDFYNPLFARIGISIHVPREGDDTKKETKYKAVAYFNPRPP